MNDHDTHTPSLDAPAGLTFRRPTPPPTPPGRHEPKAETSTPPEAFAAHGVCRPNLTRLARKAASLIRRATEGDDTKTAVELRADAETMAQSFAEAERLDREQARLLRGGR